MVQIDLLRPKCGVKGCKSDVAPYIPMIILYYPGSQARMAQCPLDIRICERHRVTFGPSSMLSDKVWERVAEFANQTLGVQPVRSECGLEHVTELGTVVPWKGYDAKRG